MEDTVKKESFQVTGGQILDTIKKLIHEGNVRKVSIKQGDNTIIEFPLTIGVVTAAIAPVLAAAGTVAALVTDCTIEVERVERRPESGTVVDETLEV